MFGEKCPKCSKRVKSKYDFCPYCGINLNPEADLDNGEYGFLGKDDLNDLGIKLPFGFNALMKPLMKELSKQMTDLDKEIKGEQKHFKEEPKRTKAVKSFSIHIGIPGQNPIVLNSGNSGAQIITKNKKEFNLPKVSDNNLESLKNLPRKEPKTNVRRLSDRIIYEIGLPGVNSLDKINISNLEDGIEIKAIGKDVIFTKMIDVSLPLKRYDFKDNLLILELGLR